MILKSFIIGIVFLGNNCFQSFSLYLNFTNENHVLWAENYFFIFAKKFRFSNLNIYPSIYGLSHLFVLRWGFSTGCLFFLLTFFGDLFACSFFLSFFLIILCFLSLLLSHSQNNNDVFILSFLLEVF